MQISLPPSVDVVVVGAGVSGLVAALRLRQRGHDVLVVEAAERVGGRALGLRVHGGAVVEGGAQWVGPSQHRVLALVRELGLTTYATHHRGRSVTVIGGVRREHRTTVPYPFPAVTLDLLRLGAGLEAAARRVDPDRPWEARGAAVLDATTLGEHLDARARTAAARAIFDVLSGLTLGGDPHDLSLLGVLAHIRSAGGLLSLVSVRGGAQERQVVGGAQVVATEMARRLDGRVVLGTPVDGVTGHGDAATVHTAAGDVRARRVVVAMSPGDRSRLRIEPVLPSGLELVHATYGAYSGIKVHAVYHRPFWRAAGLSGIGLADRGLAPVCFDSSPPDGSLGVLTTFVASAPTASPVSPTAAQLADPTLRRVGVLEALTTYIGPAARYPVDYVEQDWRQERWVAGCIPALPPGLLTTARETLLTETTGPIVWAGAEQAHTWNGYLDGAVRSGERAAELAGRAVRSSDYAGAP